MAYTLNTSLHLPLIKFTSELTYTVVEKPSGIAYMLLTLISEMKTKQTKLADLLETFKVPKDLHHIFAKELESLIDLNMIKSKRNIYNISDFKDYLVSTFTLTKDGKKAFSEKQILTDKKKQPRIESFFDPITKSYTYTFNIKYGTRQNSPLKDALYEPFLPLNLVQYKQFIEHTPNKNISYQLNETDKFIDAIIPEKSIEKLFVKYDISILIDKDNTATIDFNDSKQNEFYNNHYDVETLEEAMLLKRKFIYHLEHNKLHFQLKEFNNIQSLAFPENISEKLDDSRSWVILTTEDFANIKPKDNLYEFTNEQNLFKGLSIPYQYIVGDKKSFIGYTLIKTKLKESVFNKTFELPLLIENKLTDKESQYIIDYLYKNLRTIPLDSKVLKVISEMSTYLNDDKLKKEFLLSAIKEFESNDLVITYINDNEKSLKKYFDWNWIINAIINPLYSQYLSSITVEHLTDDYTILFTIKNLLHHDDKSFVASLSNSLALESEKDKITFCDLLLSKDINKNIIMKLVNLDDIIIDKIINKKSIPGSSKVIQEYKVLSTLYTTLTEMISLKSNDDFNIPDSLDLSTFAKQFKLYKDKFKKMNIESLDSHHANILQNQTALMQEIVSLHNAEKKMTIDVKTLDQQTIKNTFNEGNILEATIMFHSKLEFLLKILLEDDDTLVNLIDKANKTKLIDKKSADHLHILRINRNDIVHTLASKSTLDKDQIDKGFTILEALEAKYESKSND